MLITSLDNKRIKEFLKLKQKKYRDKENKFIIETEHLVQEAFLEDRLFEVFVLEGYDFSLLGDFPVYYVTEKVMNKIKGVNTSNVVGVALKKESIEYSGKRYLMLDRVSDPGNLGTIIRSAVAFGMDTLIVSLDSCDVYNEKVIRATEGAIFKINIIKDDLEVAVNNLKKLGINVYGTDVNNGIEVSSVFKDNFCVIVGNEGGGISPLVKKLVDKNIYIKTKGVESLNVAVATSIILYELSK